MAGGLKEDSDPDFSKWSIVGSYDASVACQKEKAGLVLEVPENVEDRAD
jgi:hypothetical protein